MTNETWFKVWLVLRPIIIIGLIIGAVMSYYEDSMFRMVLQIIVALGEGYFLRGQLKKIVIKN